MSPNPRPSAILAGEPKYVRIAQELRARVERGVWASGVMLPSRRRLAAEHGVSLMTLEQAIGQLLADGTLYADGGRGTFVAANAGVSPSATVALPELAPLRTSAEPPVRNQVVGVVARGHFYAPSGHTPFPWPSQVIHALERLLSQQPGFTVIEAAARDQSDELARLQWQTRDLVAAGVGLIVFVFIDHHYWTQRLIEAAGPETTCVFVGSVDLGPFVPHVAYDSAFAGYQACRHLLEAGCREILFLAPFDEEWVQARLTGARRAAASMGEGVEVRALVAPGDPMEIVGTQSALSHKMAADLAGDLAGHGVIAANDYVAMGIVQAAKEVNLVAGQDYLIVGFDDIPEARSAGLTTMHPPLDAMAAEAARLVIDQTRERHDRTQIRLRSYLIPRSSTQGPLVSRRNSSSCP